MNASIRAGNLDAISERGVHGEGNYEATRAYNATTRRFVTSGRVEEAARSAAPRDDREARSMEQAEQAGAEMTKVIDSYWAKQ